MRPRTRHRTQSRGPLLLPAVCLAALAYLLGAAQSLAISPLAAHKASYRLAMHRTSMSSDVIAVRGRLEVRLEASCDGWKIEQFLGFSLLGQEGELLEHVAHISSFESTEGREFIFATRAYEDRELTEELSGIARRLSRKRVRVNYSKPRRHSEALPADTLFPSQHVERILAAAHSGRRSLLNTVFDGSTEDNPFEISTVFGRPRVDRTSRFKALRRHTLWPVRLAYYKLGALAPAPDFEMGIQLYDHGIAGNMLYDYGDFSVDVLLETVQLLPMPSCVTD